MKWRDYQMLINQDNGIPENLTVYSAELSEKERFLLKGQTVTLVADVKIKPVGPESGIDEYCNLCSQAIERINSDYYPRAYGWISWTKGKNPELWEEIEEAERNLDEPAYRGISLEQFSNLLDQWEILINQAIKIYLKTIQNLMI